MSIPEKKLGDKYSRNIFRLSIILSFVAILLFIVFPLYSNNKQSWSIGEISHVHKSIENDCASCHNSSFKKIEDSSCLKCHKVSDHLNIKRTSHFEHTQLTNTECSTCHIEHVGGLSPIQNDTRLCTNCHSNLSKISSTTKIKNVKDFASHTEILLGTIDKANIKFNHKVHLKDGLRSDNGYKKLLCKECHNLDKSNGRMLKINFEKNCSTCHGLELEKNKRGIKIPHTNSDEVYQFIYKEYASRYFDKPKNKREITSSKPGVAKDIEAVDGKNLTLLTRDIEKDVFTKRACEYCHAITSKSEVEDSDHEKSKYAVTLTDIKDVWFPKAIFNHDKHQHLECQNCHRNISNSSSTTDLNLPSIESCKTCHSNKGGAPTDCISCHSYHESLELTAKQKKPLH